MPATPAAGLAGDPGREARRISSGGLAVQRHCCRRSDSPRCRIADDARVRPGAFALRPSAGLRRRAPASRVESARRISSRITTSCCCAPLLPFVRADYGVSYTELGLALAAFNVVSAALQTPAGFLVDRLGARILLIAGLLIGARRLRGRRADPFVLAAGRDVRARRRRQHRLSPGRLRDAVASRAGRAHRPGVLDAHLRRHARLGGRAGQPAC